MNGCATAVAEALEGLDGVTPVQIDFEGQEAKIADAPKTITVAKRIETIEQTPHMMERGMKYIAKVKP